MKDAKEALYCMGQMANKCLTSLSAIQKDYNEFVSLVKRMREAQRNYYKDKKQVGYKVAYYNMINKETLVDEYLKKMEE